MNYVYIGEYFHHNDKERVSALTEKKIGRAKDLIDRERQLNSTKFTIGYRLIKAWHTGSTTNVEERAIQALLKHDNLRGEWYRDEDGTLKDRVAKAMSIRGFDEVPLGYDEEDSNTTSDTIEVEPELMCDFLKQQAEEVSKRLTERGITPRTKYMTEGYRAIQHSFTIDDIDMEVGLYKSGKKFWVLSKNKKGMEFFEDKEGFVINGNCARLEHEQGVKGGTFATDVDTLFSQLDKFRENINNA